MLIRRRSEVPQRTTHDPTRTSPNQPRAQRSRPHTPSNNSARATQNVRWKDTTLDAWQGVHDGGQQELNGFDSIHPRGERYINTPRTRAYSKGIVFSPIIRAIILTRRKKS